MAEEYKKYDSQAEIIMHNARLTKDAQVIEGEKPLVKLSTVCTSRRDRHSDMWLEITVRDFDSAFASYLKKGDKLGFRGFPALRLWGDDNTKFSVEVDRAELCPSIELLMEVKERGFEPGAVKGAKPAAKKTTKKAPRKVVDLDDDLPADEAA